MKMKGLILQIKMVKWVATLKMKTCVESLQKQTMGIIFNVQNSNTGSYWLWQKNCVVSLPLIDTMHVSFHLTVKLQEWYFHSPLLKNNFHLNLGTPKESSKTPVKRKAPATLINSNGKEGGCDWVLATDN